MVEPAAWVSCVRCGMTANDVPLTWMTELDSARGTIHYCDRCARENLRSIEAKLPPEWW